MPQRYGKLTCHMGKHPTDLFHDPTQELGALITRNLLWDCYTRVNMVTNCVSYCGCFGLNRLQRCGFRIT